jgi:nucleotide-binding universal stress UspA family protein
MFKKILIADDLSPRALKVLQVGLELARLHKSEVVILNVRQDFLDKDEMVMLRVDVSEFHGDLSRKAKHLRAQIETDVAVQGGNDLKIEIIFREGKPGKTIPETAREVEADLIVIGTHQVSRLKEALWDGAVEQVVRHAGKTVLAVWTGAEKV